ncbi:MAG: acetyl-CoA carboxylase carboxyl transferase subunit beta, partial [Thermomicrobium sp.]
MPSLSRMTDEGSRSVSCPRCETPLAGDEVYERYRVCSHCGYHFTLSAEERIRLLVDPGTFEEFNRHLVSMDPLVFSDRLPYRKRILQAREETGLREAVITGIGRIRGHEVVLAVLDFRFLG